MRKDDVIDLPDKIISTKYYEVENKSEYETVFEEYMEWMKEEGRSLGFCTPTGRINSFKEVCCL